MTDHPRRVTRALLSVSDKTGLIEFARALAGHGVELVSTGGTAKAIAAAGLKVKDVSDLTGFPEMMDGRVKTLHPKVHGGLLAIRDNKEHAEAMKAHGIAPIDLLVVNLYPFEATVDKGAGFEDCIENIDIGGPAMIRAAAKNHDDVAVVVEAQDYQAVLDELAANKGATTLALRRRLAAKAYARTAAYDAAISNWFAAAAQDRRAGFPRLRRPADPVAALRREPAPDRGVLSRRPTSARASPPRGSCRARNSPTTTSTTPTRPMNASASSMPKRTAACVIVKHANPCGVAEGADLVSAYRKALACDSTSALWRHRRAQPHARCGGRARHHRNLHRSDHRARCDRRSHRDRRRRGRTCGCCSPAACPIRARVGLTAKTVAGGLLVQSRDNAVVDDMTLKVVTKRAPTDAELRDLKFAFRVAKHVKSNTIIYAKDLATVGIGAGQMSRVDSARIAARKAQDAATELKLAEPLTKGSVVASDAFFPFADGMLACIEAGATAVIQPGGSMRDDEVIKAADEHGIAMVFTGVRHFRH